MDKPTQTLPAKQRIGRLAELYVEKVLTEAGWLCGNFNMSVQNSAHWDLFAKLGSSSAAIRVKGASGTDITWSHKGESAFSGLAAEDSSDWTAIVTFVDTSPEVYFIPTMEIVKYIPLEEVKYFNLLHLYFHVSKSKKLARPWQYGLNEVFARYRNATDLLSIG